MGLIIAWTALGLFVGCWVGNTVNKNWCYQSVKKLLTNNLKHDIILSMGEQFSLISFNNSIYI